MRAKFLREVQNFERKGTPLKKMNIGMTDKKILNKAVKDLKEVGLDARWEEEFGYSGGVYRFIINTITDLQITYANEETAKEEWGGIDAEGAEEGGWGLLDNSGELLFDITHDWNKIFKEIIKLKYGNKQHIQNNINSLEEELKNLKKVKKYYES